MSIVYLTIIFVLLFLLACSLAFNLWLVKLLEERDAESEFEWAEEEE